MNWDAQTYDDNFGRHQRQFGFQLLAENYAKVEATPYPSKALDLGCGTGAVTKLVAHFPNFATVVGLDVDEGMVEKARNANSDARISFVQGNACDFQTFPPDSEESFSLVTAVATLHWWPDPQQGIENAFRALKPGGHFIGYTWVCASKLHPLQVQLLECFLKSDREYEKYLEALKESLTARHPSNAQFVYMNEREAEDTVRGLLIRPGFTVERCELVHRKIHRTKLEARSFYEYFLRGPIKELGVDADTGKLLLDKLAEKYLNSLEPGPNNSVIDKHRFVEFCCAKPQPTFDQD